MYYKYMQIYILQIYTNRYKHMYIDGTTRWHQFALRSISPDHPSNLGKAKNQNCTVAVADYTDYALTHLTFYSHLRS